MRDYTVGGPEAPRAVAHGLAEAQWYVPEVPRTVMRDLVVRTNVHAAIHVATWLVLLVGSGLWVHVAWGTWWVLPACVVYGVMYGSASDSHWHECGHRTAFRTKWLNDAVYHLAAFMDVREPESWRWSHARHHSDTIIVGRDPEIAFPRGVSRFRFVADIFGLIAIPTEFVKYARNAFGRPSAAQRDYQPAEELWKSTVWSWVFLLVHAAVIVWSVVAGSWEPLVLVGLPSVYGRWLMVLYGVTQHAGLAEDVLDHRLNTRTVHMGAVNRFMYWNMNYHLEHHMFPNVPSRTLPQLHAAVKDQLPAAYPGIISVLRDVVPALRRQRTDVDFVLSPELPVGV